MNVLFNIKYDRKRKIFDRNIQKDMIITVDIHEKNKKLNITIQPKNACKLVFADNLWLPFFDQIQSDIIVFSMINFQIYQILVS